MTDDISELLWQPAWVLLGTLKRREVSAIEILDALFERIECANKPLNFICSLNMDEAYTSAAKSDAILGGGASPRPLEGIPFAIKDITPTKGLVTTMGSRVFRDFVPAHDAVIVERLRQAGAVLVAKTTTSEFANASVTESPLTGITRNPWNPNHMSGGSSGGSAVAVAAGCVPFAEGSDMGGSVRIPACFCGLVGLKPSLGRIPFAISPSVYDPLAHHGPICRDVFDAALFLSSTAGPDNSDPQSLPGRFDVRELGDNLTGLRVGYSKDFGFVSVHPDVIVNFEKMLIKLQDRGAEVEESKIRFDDDFYQAGLHIFSAMITGYYGYLEADHRSDLDPTLMHFFDIGTRLSAVDLVNADIVRTRYWNSFRSVFDSFDAFVCPTMPRPAPLVGMSEFDYEGKDENGQSKVFDMTLPFNLFGQLPAITIPSGLSQSRLPTGLQIVANRYDEITALTIAYALHDPAYWSAKLRALRYY